MRIFSPHKEVVISTLILAKVVVPETNKGHTLQERENEFLSTPRGRFQPASLPDVHETLELRQANKKPTPGYMKQTF